MEPVTEPVGAVAASFIFGALVLKFVDFLKYLKNLDWNGVVTIAIGWVAGVAAVQLTLLTQWADEIKIGSETLDKLNFGSQLVLGLVATSVAAVVYDIKKAVDNTETASTPRFGRDAETDRKARVQNALPS